jgi:hypothetical protein
LLPSIEQDRQHLEVKMNKSTILAVSAASLSAALLSLSLLSAPANASTTSMLMNCKYNTKQKVIDCCQRILRKQPKPIWLEEGSSGCAAVAKCSKTGPSHSITYVPQRCYIQIPSEGGGTGSERTPQGRRLNFTFN